MLATGADNEASGLQFIDAPGTPTQAEADAAEIAEIHRQMDEVRATDYAGCGLEAGNEIRMDRLMTRLKAIRDRQRGITPNPREFADANAKPLNRKPKRAKRRTWADVVPNPCHCGKHDFCVGGAMPKKHKRATSAYDLCTRGPGPNESAMCQVYQLLREALRTGKHPADFLEERHWFTPTQDDREHIEFVCWMNLKDWLRLPEVKEANLMDFITAYQTTNAKGNS